VASTRIGAGPPEVGLLLGLSLGDSDGLALGVLLFDTSVGDEVTAPGLGGVFVGGPSVGTA